MGSGQKVELKARSPCDSGSIKTSLDPLTAAVCIKLLTLLYWSASLLCFSWQSSFTQPPFTFGSLSWINAFWHSKKFWNAWIGMQCPLCVI